MASAFRAFLLTLLVGLAANPAAAGNSELTNASIALSKQVKKAWALTLVCTGPIKNDPEASGYLVAKLTYNLWFEVRRFVHFAKRPPKNPQELTRLFERLQLIIARVDGMLAPAGPAGFLGQCAFRAAWDEVKEKMAAVSQAMGRLLVGQDPPIQFPPGDGSADEVDDDTPPGEMPPPPAATPAASPKPPVPQASPSASAPSPAGGLPADLVLPGAFAPANPLD